MVALRVASAVILVTVTATTNVAGARGLACTETAECAPGDSCVEGQCWPLTGGVPERCAGFVDGDASSICKTTSHLEDSAQAVCTSAGGRLEDQLHGESCGDGTFRSSLNLCCLPPDNGGDIIQGTNVEALRERIRQQLMEEHLGCAGGSGRGGLPGVLLGLGLVLAGLRRAR